MNISFLLELLPLVNRIFLLILLFSTMEVALTIEEAFGQVIRELRKAKSFSQEKLSDVSTLNRTFISHLERGRKQPSLITIFQLAKALSISAAAITSMVEEKIGKK